MTVFIAFPKSWGKSGVCMLLLVLSCLSSCAWRDTDQLSTNHPRLFFTPADIPILRGKATTREGQAIIAQLRHRLAAPYDALYLGSWAAGYGLLYVISGDPRDAQKAAQIVQMVLADSLRFVSLEREQPLQTDIKLWGSDFKAIYRAPNIMGVAMTYDLCYNAWEVGFREMVADELADKTIKLLEGGGEGWNPNPWSNWHGITKGGGGVAALALEGDPGTGEDFGTYVDKAKSELVTHLQYLGDKAWTPEGFDYLRYELCTGVLPFVQAYKQVYDIDLADSAAMLKWPLPLYIMQSVQYGGTFLTPDYGPSGVAWNTNRWRSGDWVMAMGTAGTEFLPAALWMFDPVFGMEGDRSFDIYKPSDAVFALVNYPVDLEKENPSSVLPRAWADTTGGYYIFRNTWDGPDDLVATMSTNALARPSSHSHKEAGSFRIIGLGEVWASRGTRTPGVRNENLENTVKVEGATNWRGASVRYFATNMGENTTTHPLPEQKPQYACLTMDMTRTYLGGTRLTDSLFVGVTSATRSFAVQYLPGNKAFYVVYDEILGGGEKVWEMYTPLQTVEVFEHGFTIRNDAGDRLTGRFITPVGAEVVFDPVARKVIVEGSEQFLVVLTLQSEAVDIEVSVDAENTTCTVQGYRIVVVDGKIFIEPE